MLSNYAKEINILSNKKISFDVANEAISEIKNKLPKDKKNLEKILAHSTQYLINSIKNGDYRESFGLLRFIFFTGFKNPIDEIRKQGAFRASKAKFKSKLIKELIQELFNSHVLTDDEQNYLRNVNGLLEIVPDVLDLKNKIIAAAKSRRYFIKTILAFAEEKYIDTPMSYDNHTEKSVVDLIFNKNKESILSAASYVLQVFIEDVGELKIDDFCGIDECIKDDYYHSILEQAFILQNYLDAEVKVDFYDYEVKVHNDGKIISVQNEKFETAKSHGFTKSEMRAFSQFKMYYDIANSKSFYQILEEFWERDSKESKSIAYTIERNPIERIVVTAICVDYLHETNIFSHDTIFKEEFIQLMMLADENYNGDFINTKICGAFTCLDIFKLQRFFGYVGFIYMKVFGGLKSSGISYAEIIRRRSVLPVFNSEWLIGIFHKTTGKSEGECKFLLNKLTNSGALVNEIIDLQYKPIIEIEGRYLVLPTVFACSNLVRSLAKNENVHLSVFDNKDHMVSKLSKTLVNQGFIVEQDFQYGIDEVDIAAVFENHLFLFECKNPYHPVNDFELRNTYSHLKKGFLQMEKFKKRFNDKNSLKQFIANLKVPSGKIEKVHYGIINANRALVGLSHDDVKVFHANEFMNFISSGIIVSGGKKFLCWKSEKFQIEDLISYMNGRVITDDLISHKLPMPYFFRLRNHILYFQSFQYEMERVHIFQAEKYQYLGPSDYEGH